MVRLFNVYYPVRTLVLLVGEAVLICASFLIATLIQYGSNSGLALNAEYGLYKIFGITFLALLCSYYLDLYDSKLVRPGGETTFRVLTFVGTLSLALAGLGFVFPEFLLGRSVYLTGLIILMVALLGWRSVYAWMTHIPMFREKVYVLGDGDRSERLVNALNENKDLGLDVVGWEGPLRNGSFSRENVGRTLLHLRDQRSVDRIIVALGNRRGTMPVRELLELRLSDVIVEDATRLLEKISGKIEVEDLNPSWLIFADGFRLSRSFLLVRRLGSMLMALLCLILTLPLIPFVFLMIKLDSPGPALYKQKRVGHKGSLFTCYKFRTMRQDAEADTGPTWAGDGDPRITKTGRFLRTCRLDEIPQLWNVLRGDMEFVGPRPERPEFVEWLAREIPFYQLRHTVPPGVTGWAQVRYKYGNTLEDSREKLMYDLFYIKNLSIGLDLMILFQTVKTVLLGRGAQ